MELFERILFLEGIFGSRKAIAEALEITPQKLSAYCNTTSQKNLWEHLPKLLKVRQDISKSWLYYEEGEMIKNDQHPTVDDSNIQNYLETIRILTETNRKLTEELLKSRIES